MEELHESVRNLDPEDVKRILHASESSVDDTVYSKTTKNPVFNLLVSSLQENPKFLQQAVKLTYILRNSGFNINHQDEDGNVPLLSHLQSKTVNAEFVEALLRCNADIYAVNKNGINAIEELNSNQTLPEEVRNVFEKYMPGMWQAVENDDLMSVRRLVNQWCRVDIEKDGKTLLQLATEREIVNMIRLVGEIKPSMEVAHGVLADDAKLVERALQSNKKINVNFRNLGDRASSPLYYALCNSNEVLVDLLLSHGARLDISLNEGDESDIPLCFAVLMNQPSVSAKLLEKVMMVKPSVAIDKLTYKGRNVLFHCIDFMVSADVVESILRNGTAYLVTMKSELNKTPREYAVQLNRLYIVECIDKTVFRWCFEEEDNANRKLIALHGYEHLVMPLEAADTKPLEDERCQANHLKNILFFQHIGSYQEHVGKFIKAVEENDTDAAQELLFIKCEDLFCFERCLVDARYKGDGQPVLQKAVFRRNTELVRSLAQVMVFDKQQRLDSVRDQFFRTALHYAYAMEDFKEMSDVLLDFGASEFAMDKDGRSPLAFKDRRELKLMADLLDYQQKQDFSNPEPDPWSLPLPLPIIGYLVDCSNCHHLHSGPSSRIKALTYQQTMAENASSSQQKQDWSMESSSEEDDDDWEDEDEDDEMNYRSKNASLSCLIL